MSSQITLTSDLSPLWEYFTLMTPSTTVGQLKASIKATVLSRKLSGALDLNL